MNRINILPIDEKILNKRNRNLDSYYVNENTSPDNNNFSETLHNNISFNTSTDDTEPIFPATLQTPSKTKERSTLILFLILLSGLHLRTDKVRTQTQFMKKLGFKVLKTTFYKIFAKVLLKYLTTNLSTLKLNVKTQ